MKIGFIGIGRMGEAIAGRVLAGGHELTVYNRTPAKAAALVQAGATLAENVAAACHESEVVMTMLADDGALEQVSRGADGILASLPGGAIHMPMGTHGVDLIRLLTRAHADAGQVLVAAPVLGRPEAAAEGQIGVVTAGPAEAMRRCEPLFRAVGRRTFFAGEAPEAATAVKLANNFVLGCAIEAMGEGFALTRKFGVAPQVFYDVLSDGLFAAPAYKVYGRIIAERAYDQVGFTANLGLKDANLALAAGGAVGVPLPSGNVWRDRVLGAIAHGEGECDWAVMAKDQARASGLEE
jgi:3-hydroxyisobutyrate dehydrogenase-like beta-hydroxyacid dehydrogenase